jgi:hypothetical protein
MVSVPKASAVAEGVTVSELAAAVDELALLPVLLQALKAARSATMVKARTVLMSLFYK